LIRYELPKKTKVEIEIYDGAGRRVKTLLSGVVDRGIYQLEWDGRDDKERQVSSGIYFVRMKAGEFESIKKLVYLRRGGGR
jgi:flagellar hook assembly protein FlgD